MKKINLKEFLALPEGTLFTQWGWLCIKGKNCNDNDFFEEIITPLQDGNDDFGRGYGRWGELDNTAEFFVFDEEDIKSLVNKIRPK